MRQLLLAALAALTLTATPAALAGGFSSPSPARPSVSFSSPRPTSTFRPTSSSVSTRSSSTTFSTRPGFSRSSFPRSLPTIRVPGSRSYAPRVAVPVAVHGYPLRPASGAYFHVYDTTTHMWLWIAYANAINHGWAPQQHSNNDALIVLAIVLSTIFVMLVVGGALIYTERI